MPSIAKGGGVVSMVVELQHLPYVTFLSKDVQSISYTTYLLTSFRV